MSCTFKNCDVKSGFDFILDHKLKNLRKIYCMLQESVKLINECMGFTIMLHTLLASISLVCDLYQMFLLFAGGDTVDKVYSEAP